MIFRYKLYLCLKISDIFVTYLKRLLSLHTHCKDDHEPSKRIGTEGGSCDLFQGTILVFVQRLGKTSNNVKIASNN